MNTPNGNRFPARSTITNTPFATPVSFPNHEVGSYPHVHNPGTPSWHRTPPMNTVLEGWQNSLPKLHKYPADQLQVVFHRSGEKSHDTFVVSNSSSRTPSVPSKLEVKVPSSMSKSLATPTWNRRVAHPNSAAFVAGSKIFGKPPVRFGRGLDLRSLLKRPPSGYNIGADSILHNEESNQRKTRIGISSSAFPKSSTISGTDKTLSDCVSCESLKGQLVKANEDLYISDLRLGESVKLVDILRNENAKVLKENERLEALLRRVKEENDTNTRVLDQMKNLESLLVAAAKGKKDLEYSDGLLSSAEMEKFIIKGNLSPDASTPLGTPMTGKICTPPALTPIEKVQLESPVWRLDRSIKQIRADFQRLSARRSPFVLPSNDDSFFRTETVVLPGVVTSTAVESSSGEVAGASSSETAGPSNGVFPASANEISETPRVTSKPKSKPRVLNETFTED